MPTMEGIFTCRLAEHLRSLFNLFVGHVIKEATELLKQNNTLNGGTVFPLKSLQTSLPTARLLFQRWTSLAQMLLLCHSLSSCCKAL